MPTMSVSVGRTFETGCLSVCPQHNSKTNDPKVIKLGRPIGSGLWILAVTWLWDGKVKGHGHSVNNTTNDTSFQTIIALHPHSLGGDTDKSNMAWVRTI